MKILFTADPEISVPPRHYGGVQRLVDGLIGAFRKQGHTVGLVANKDSESAVDYFRPFPGNESQNYLHTIGNTYALWRACKEFQPDVVHSFSRLLYLLPLLPASMPKIMTYGRYPGKQQVSNAARLAQNLVFTGCSDHIVETGKKGGGNWKRVYNYVELEKYSFREQVADDAPLVFLSRIERIKGVHQAIAIAQQAGKQLIIAGNRPELRDAKAYWNSEVAPHIDGDQIQYIGSVDDKRKNELLGSASALVVPIEWEEPFGMVFIEALACGTPVISTARGAVPEIIRAGKEGFTIGSTREGVDAVGKISGIDRRNCRQRVEEMFTLSIIADEYFDIYRELAGKTGSDAG